MDRIYENMRHKSRVNKLKKTFSLILIGVLTLTIMSILMLGEEHIIIP